MSLHERLPDIITLSFRRMVAPVRLADPSVQLLDLPPAPQASTRKPADLTLAEMMDIRTYDRRINAARGYDGNGKDFHGGRKT